MWFSNYVPGYSFTIEVEIYVHVKTCYANIYDIFIFILPHTGNNPEKLQQVNKQTVLDLYTEEIYREESLVRTILPMNLQDYISHERPSRAWSGIL